MGTGEAVPAELTRRHPELGRLRLRRGGLFPRLGGWCLGAATVDGITLWGTVWLGRGTRASGELLLHELCHVHQFQSVRAFPLRYVWESLRNGYHHNRFEVDARQFAAERLRGVAGEPPNEGA
jgi:hypothetical protein